MKEERENWAWAGGEETAEKPCYYYRMYVLRVKGEITGAPPPAPSPFSSYQMSGTREDTKMERGEDAIQTQPPTGVVAP